VFDELQQRHPGQFVRGQLRTLHRHIAVWRAKTVLAFDDSVADDLDHLTLASLPRPLRVAVEVNASAEYSA
jgi:hypothetical protein